MQGRPRLVVEPWAPDFGSPTELDSGPESTPAVEIGAEPGGWRPIAPAPASAEALQQVVLVDGVRRIEARVTVDDDEQTSPRPGVLGVWAVGAVSWWPGARRAEVSRVVCQRQLIVGSGGADHHLEAAAARLGAKLVTVPASDPSALGVQLQVAMRHAEAELADELLPDADLVLVDGPLRTFANGAMVGFIKTQHTPYLAPAAAALVGKLAAGERTPLFAFVGPKYPRWSWYVRLAEVPGGHSWSGIARVECPGSLGRDAAIALADASAAILPRLAPPLHVDPRAPQNLVPIAALERRLKHLLGDPGLAWRRAREVAWAA
jgi:hypothetical protein